MVKPLGIIVIMLIEEQNKKQKNQGGLTYGNYTTNESF